jgi:hypothetical protein
MQLTKKLADFADDFAPWGFDAIHLPATWFALVKSSRPINEGSAVQMHRAHVLGAALVSYILEKSGVSKVAIVDGGLSGYKAASQSTTKAFPTFAAFEPLDRPVPLGRAEARAERRAAAPEQRRPTGVPPPWRCWPSACCW